MIPHSCIVKHDPPNSYGDCIRACVASVLSIDRTEDVPHFFHDDPDPEVAMKRIAEWCATVGVAPFYSYYAGHVTYEDILNVTEGTNPNVYQVLMGENHAVVIRGGKKVHDPGWTKSPLDPPMNDHAWVLMTFVPLSVTLCK